MKFTKKQRKEIYKKVLNKLESIEQEKLLFICHILDDFNYDRSLSLYPELELLKSNENYAWLSFTEEEQKQEARRFNNDLQLCNKYHNGVKATCLGLAIAMCN